MGAFVFIEVVRGHGYVAYITASKLGKPTHMPQCKVKTQPHV